MLLPLHAGCNFWLYHNNSSQRPCWLNPMLILSLSTRGPKAQDMAVTSRVHTVLLALVVPSQSPGFILPHLPTEAFVRKPANSHLYADDFSHISSLLLDIPGLLNLVTCDVSEICFSWSLLTKEFILSRLQRSLQSFVFDSMSHIKIIWKSSWIYLQKTFKILPFPRPSAAAPLAKPPLTRSCMTS